jgi:isopenicillin N synthase-like dioxygenase
VRDPRVTEENNQRFLDMIEDYFNQPEEQKLKDARPELGYQVGVTPGLREVPKCGVDPRCQEIIARMPESCRPAKAEGPDPKWRFFWRIGEQPKNSQFPQLNADPVIPEGFPQWESIMNNWGNHMHRAVYTVAEMAAIGFGLPADAFTSLSKGGPHLLAPTASDLNIYNKPGTVLAGFHYDLTC